MIIESAPSDHITPLHDSVTVSLADSTSMDNVLESKIHQPNPHERSNDITLHGFFLDGMYPSDTSTQLFNETIGTCHAVVRFPHRFRSCTMETQLKYLQKHGSARVNRLLTNAMDIRSYHLMNIMGLGLYTHVEQLLFTTSAYMCATDKYVYRKLEPLGMLILAWYITLRKDTMLIYFPPGPDNIWLPSGTAFGKSAITGTQHHHRRAKSVE